ncbi:uncharacterized protein LOC127870349 isoform X2 [Dreissena polymorpha]|nr:uncharacterized protein LOC127870349 isoform X2 [Dreissena polymorpha]XP_052268934.1 uncharacterized protein LOC127870349 isoform X2 [Dreissena polymorpha]
MTKKIIFLVIQFAVTTVFADDQECNELGDCDCGDVCHDGKCVAGCHVYDVFVAAGTQRTVYGRRCQCDSDTDPHGRAVKCAEGVAFEGNPIHHMMYTPNPRCYHSDDAPTA